MILYEFEGKKLLADVGVNIPNSQLIVDSKAKSSLRYPLVLKAQVLSGKRAQAGGIVITQDSKQLNQSLENLFGKVINKEKVEKVLVEEKIDFQPGEFYISISYDTNCRGPILTVSQSGGTGIEEKEVKVFAIDPLQPEKVLEQDSLFGIDNDLLKKLINLFFTSDSLLIEINPLVRSRSNQWIALDAKIKLDETALKRHPEWQFAARGVPGYSPSQREVAAKKIDEEDYRGVAGSTYFDLNGDIAILASGGGASMTAMDALLEVGGKPANYTEYSGNPPKEKVEKLTEIVLSKPNLNGLWVVGAIANFTDIYQTLSGLVEGLRQAQTKLDTKFDFPIVIRRGGPKDKEAFEMLGQVKDFNLHLFGEETSITQSAQIMVDLAKKYQLQKGKH